MSMYGRGVTVMPARMSALQAESAIDCQQDTGTGSVPSSQSETSLGDTPQRAAACTVLMFCASRRNMNVCPWTRAMNAKVEAARR
jgi:hypothetical protein